MKQEKLIALTIIGIVAIVLIVGIILMLSGENTGKIVTYKYSNPNICYETIQETCLRHIRCETWHDAEPVIPQPGNTPPGFVACKCPNQLDPQATRFVMPCQ